MKINLKPSFSNGRIRILKLEKVKDAWYDYLDVVLHYPIIKFGTLVNDIYDRETKYSINLNTDISYTYSDVWVSFIFRVLGFGFSINRSYGY